MPTNKSKEIQQNTPGWALPPDTADMTALRGIRDEGADYATPIRNRYARAEQKLSQSYNNPLGAFTTPDVRDKAMREQTLNMNQMMGSDLADAAQQNAAAKWGRYAQMAGMTAPRMYMAKSQNSQPWTGGDTVNSIFRFFGM